MGTLHSDTTNVSNVVNQSNSNISANVHQLLLLQWRKDMASNKEEFISMPLNEEELDRITSDFETLGIVGCCGSMDVVHRGWDSCPAEFQALFVGKEHYATVAFQVIVACHRRQVLHVRVRAFLGQETTSKLSKLTTHHEPFMMATTGCAIKFGFVIKTILE